MKLTRNFSFASVWLLVVAVCAIAVAPPARSQTQPNYPVYNTPKSLNMAGIGTIAAATTQTCTNLVIDCRKFQNVTLQAQFNWSGATTSNVVYVISKSVDGLNFETTPQYTWTIAGNGTTDVISTTNLTVGGLGWLKLNSIQNTHASLVVTNKAFLYSDKRNSP